MDKAIDLRIIKSSSNLFKSFNTFIIVKILSKVKYRCNFLKKSIYIIISVNRINKALYFYIVILLAFFIVLGLLLHYFSINIGYYERIKALITRVKQNNKLILSSDKSL